MRQDCHFVGNQCHGVLEAKSIYNYITRKSISRPLISVLVMQITFLRHAPSNTRYITCAEDEYEHTVQIWKIWCCTSQDFGMKSSLFFFIFLFTFKVLTGNGPCLICFHRSLVALLHNHSKSLTPSLETSVCRDLYPPAVSFCLKFPMKAEIHSSNEEQRWF